MLCSGARRHRPWAPSPSCCSGVLATPRFLSRVGSSSCVSWECCAVTDGVATTPTPGTSCCEAAAFLRTYVCLNEDWKVRDHVGVNKLYFRWSHLVVSECVHRLQKAWLNPKIFSWYILVVIQIEIIYVLYVVQLDLKVDEGELVPIHLCVAWSASVSYHRHESVDVSTNCYKQHHSVVSKTVSADTTGATGEQCG